MVVSLRALLDRVIEVRPARSGTPGRNDWIELLLLAAVFALASFTPPRGADGAPNAPFQGFLDARTGGGVCVFRRVTGFPCPSCGLTRGFVQLAHGHPVEAVRLNPLTPVFFALLGARAFATLVLCVFRRDVSARISWPMAWRLWGALGVALVSLGVYRIAAQLVS